jgi:hypothetical protein
MLVTAGSATPCTSTFEERADALDAVLSLPTHAVDNVLVTAIERRDVARTANRQYVSPIAEVVVFGITAFAFALFPGPIRATLELITPEMAEILTTVLTWGLVVLWVAYVIRLATLGRLRA